MYKKNYEELEMKDDFMFGKIMSNKELCREKEMLRVVKNSRKEADIIRE